MKLRRNVLFDVRPSSSDQLHVKGSYILGQVQRMSAIVRSCDHDT